MKYGEFSVNNYSINILINIYKLFILRKYIEISLIKFNPRKRLHLTLIRI